MPEQRMEHTIRLDKKYVEAVPFASYPIALQTKGVWFHALKKNRSECGTSIGYVRLNGRGA